jgi:hypothetical protein
VPGAQKPQKISGFFTFFCGLSDSGFGSGGESLKLTSQAQSFLFSLQGVRVGKKITGHLTGYLGERSMA